jgi:hypothetical protein
VGRIAPAAAQALELNRKSFGDLAAETGIARGSLEKVLSPAGPAAGRLVAEKLELWLAKGPTPNGNGAAPASAPVENEAMPSPSPAPQAGNGHAGATERRPRDGQLSEAEREKLAGFRALDPHALRRTSGLTADQVARAVAGEALAADVIDRARGFLRC